MVVILIAPRKIGDIAQSRANGSIYVLQDELLHQASNPLFNLVNMLLANRWESRQVQRWESRQVQRKNND